MHHERNYITEQSPIMQAMLATQAPPPPKRRPPKAGPEPSLLAGPSQRPGLAGPSQRRQKGVAFAVGNDKGPSVGHLPSAEAYVPPSTFLQTMAKPEPRSAAMTGVLADLWGGTS
jgi:hypothetical protein